MTGIDGSSEPGPEVYTAGYSLLDLESFGELIAHCGTETLVDVRSLPERPGRFTPWFSGDELRGWCREQGVDYRFFGGALGGIPDDKHGDVQSWKESGSKHAWYEQRSSEREVLSACRKVLRLPDPVLLLCACKDDTECHRRLLVAGTMLGMEEGPERIGHLRYEQSRSGGHCVLEPDSVRVSWQTEPDV